MEEAKYILYNTLTGEALSEPITLAKWEVDKFNYAYALNGVQKKYEKVSDA